MTEERENKIQNSRVCVPRQSGIFRLMLLKFLPELGVYQYYQHWLYSYVNFPKLCEIPLGTSQLFLVVEYSEFQLKLTPVDAKPETAHLGEVHSIRVIFIPLVFATIIKSTATSRKTIGAQVLYTPQNEQTRRNYLTTSSITDFIFPSDTASTPL